MENYQENLRNRKIILKSQNIIGKFILRLQYSRGCSLYLGKDLE